MNHNSLLQSFAVNKDGLTVSVDEVSRGLACECFCPACAEPVIARQGSVRSWHFAHTSGVECTEAAETALHKAAKEIIRRHAYLMLPGFEIEKQARLPDGRAATATRFHPVVRSEFSTVSIEVDLGEVKPDAICSSAEYDYLVEIAVTHFVDEEKLEKLKALDMPSLEITLSPSEHEVWDWGLLEAHVLQQTANKKWLHHPLIALLEEEAEHEALAAANAMPIPAKSLESTEPKKNYYNIGGTLVVATDWPSNTVVWNKGGMREEQFKTLCAVIKRLGGQWRGHKGNWWVPSGVRDLLHRALAKCSIREISADDILSSLRTET